MTDHRIKIVSVPVLDTGIGREAGFADDRALIEAARLEREALPPTVRKIVNDAEVELQWLFLFGDPS